MGALSIRIGPLLLWQAMLLIGVLAGGAFAGYTLTPAAEVSSDAAVTDSDQVVVARVGDLVDAISTSGNVVFPERKRAAFAINGEVSKVLVEQGQSIKQEGALAEIDIATKLSLEKALAKAKVDLSDAQKALDEAVANADAKSVATARDTVAKRRVTLKTKTDEYDDLRIASDEEVADAESLIVKAKTSLANAEKDLAADERTIATDEEAELTLVQDARTAYGDMFSRWLGVSPTSTEADESPSKLLSAWDVDLGKLFGTATSVAVVPDRYTTSTGITPDDPNTSWNESTVDSWVSLFPGKLVGTCAVAPAGAITDKKAISGTLCVQQEIQDAYDALASALVAVEDGKLKSSKKRFTAQAAIDSAKNTLATREEALVTLKNPDPLELAQSKSAVTLAKANLLDAESDLTELVAGTDKLQVGKLRAELAVSKQALVTAQTNLDGATLKAPIAGIVYTLNMEEGDRANANQVYMEIVDTTIVEVSGDIDEVDILGVQEGAEVGVTMIALEDENLTGKIQEVGTATTQQGVVKFPIKIRVNVPPNQTLREGLSATAKIVISEYNDVVMVPTSSITGSFLAPTIRVLVDGLVEERQIQLGPSDDFWVTVVAGVVAGESVLIPKPAATNSRQQGFRGLFGGGSSRGRGRGSGGGGGGRR